MTISFNNKKAEEQSFTRVGPGRYLCEVELAEEMTSSGGDPMIKLRWRHVEGGFTACFDYLVFSDKGVGIAHKKLKAMGYRLPAEGSDEEVAVDAADLIGLQSHLTLVEEVYKGKKNLKPDFDSDGFGYAPAGPAPSPSAPAANSIAQAFDEQIPF